MATYLPVEGMTHGVRRNGVTFCGVTIAGRTAGRISHAPFCPECATIDAPAAAADAAAAWEDNHGTPRRAAAWRRTARRIRRRQGRR